MKKKSYEICPQCGGNTHELLNPRGVIDLGKQAYFCLLCNIIVEWVSVGKGMGRSPSRNSSDGI